MAQYSLVEKQDGTIEFWTDDKDLRLRAAQNIRDIADAISFRRHIMRVDKNPTDRKRGNYGED